MTFQPDPIKSKAYWKNVCCTAHFMTNRYCAFLYLPDIYSYNRRP